MAFEKQTVRHEEAERQAPLRSTRALVGLVLLALLTTLGVTQPAAAAGRLQLSLAVNTTEFYPNQAVVVTGQLKSASGKALVGRTVYVHEATSDGWKRIATTTTKTNGHYRMYIRETSGAKIRTYAAAYNDESATTSTTTATLKKIEGTETIEERVKTLRPTLRDATSEIKTGTSYGKTIRYQTFERGMLVQAYGRVFVVASPVLRGYINAGGPTGKLGIPTSDMDCYITVERCVQPFKGGAIYYNADSVTAANTHVAYGSGVGAEIIAATMSQVGYEEPSWQTNKFTAWNGRKTAWCGVFLSWASAATKNGDAVPQVDTFNKLVAAVKERGVTYKPRVGALVFMNFSGGSEGVHVGIVTKVHANGSFDTIEGNTHISPDPQRLVAKKTRYPSQARYYYIPGT